MCERQKNQLAAFKYKPLLADLKYVKDEIVLKHKTCSEWIAAMIFNTTCSKYFDKNILIQWLIFWQNRVKSQKLSELTAVVFDLYSKEKTNASHTT